MFIYGYASSDLDLDPLIPAVNSMFPAWGGSHAAASAPAPTAEALSSNSASAPEGLPEPAQHITAAMLIPDPAEVRQVHDQIVKQHLFNKNTAHHYCIYSDKFPADTLLSEHQKTVLHMHLISSQKPYYLEQWPPYGHLGRGVPPPVDTFRIYPNGPKTGVIKPTAKLIEDLKM